MQKKIRTAVLAVLVLAIGLMSVRMVVAIVPQQAQGVDTDEGVSYLIARENADAAENENTVRAAQEQHSSAKQEQKEAAALANGNYNAAFKDVLIAGDSLVQAMVEYGILDDALVMAKVGAGTKYLTEISDDIIAANPQYLVLHFGENELDEMENAVYFINRYTKCIQYLQSKLPSAQIYVDSIFPVQEKAYEDEPYTRNIDQYNALLLQMAKDLNVTFIDFTPLWQAADKEYHDADGIHPVYSFYTELYLPTVYTEVKGKH